MAEELFKNLMYGDMLNSPGYEVEYAVGLTYSLDLDALISVPMSFGLLGESEEIVNKSPAYLLAAIRKSSDKMAVFCNAGNIKVPKESRVVYSLLENCIFQVKQKGSFHPKLWVVQEKNENGKRRIRLVVLSRNLTFDDSIDIVVSLTGDVSGSEHNRKPYMPVVNLLDWVAKFASKEKRDMVRKVCDSIRHVNKFIADAPFEEECEFYTFNDKLMSQADVMDVIQGTDAIIFSPFIEEKTLEWLFKKARRKILVTRRNFITQPVLDMVGKGNVYSVNEGLLDDEETSIDLHAKIYFISKDGYNDLYLGSANATYSAFNRNSELLLRLRFQKNASGYEKFRKAMLEDDDNQFVPVCTSFADDNSIGGKPMEDKVLREVIRNIIGAKVKISGKMYDTVVSFKKCDWNMPVKIMTLQGVANRANVTITKETVIPGTALKDLSDFYVITVGSQVATQVRTIVKIDTEGIPPERDDVLFQSIVDTESKFINYISFLLTENPQEYIYNEEQQRKLLQRKGASRETPVVSSLYEDMLVAMTHHSDRLDVIEEDIDKFGDKVPESFRQMLEVFKESRKSLREFKGTRKNVR